MAVLEIIMILIRTSIRTMRHAHRAMILANQAEEPDQRNMQLCNLGSSLIIIGVINVATIMVALVWQQERMSTYSNYMHVILSVILGFIAVSGLSGITVGMFLLSMNNPGMYRHVAMVMLWASFVAAALAVGILLTASFYLL